VRLLRAAFPDRPVLDMAVSHALLQRVAAGALESTLRLYRPGPTLAFGRLDLLRPGFADAVAAARAHGLQPVVRLAGGHAAAYDERSLIYEEITRQQDVTAGLHERFRDGAALLADALRGLGVDAVVGEIPGEYCAGGYTVSAAGRLKLVGIAQRAVRGGALLSAFVIVAGGAPLRAALVDVYRALDLAWEPSTAGALDDVAPGIGIVDVERAILAGRAIAPAQLDDATLARARELEERHRSPSVHTP
jgi:octanoyl-[GcvH]:protein N-octanoyltransferase